MDKEHCARVEFLESSIFPVLLPGLEATLSKARDTERRRLFDPLNFLAGYLYRNNPHACNREDTDFKDIPFVEGKWSIDPPPVTPLSATLTEEEAATMIQAVYRGRYTRRHNAHIVEFLKWKERFARETVAARKIQKCWRNYEKKKRLREIVAQESA